MKVEHILHHIDFGSIALPEFQRGYVWNRDQVRDLMHSLYRRYPVGSLLVWAPAPRVSTCGGQTARRRGWSSCCSTASSG
jgi:uncharacterized protein with ParB-like and HNH nuclease domain